MKSKSSYDFLLNIQNATELPTDYIFNYQDIKLKSKELLEIESALNSSTLPNNKLISEYNERYISIYKDYDHSHEFRQALERQTFDTTKRMPRFEELTEEYDDLNIPFLDQRSVAKTYMAAHQRFWSENGFLLIRGLIDEGTCNEYLALRQDLNLGRRSFPTFTPYLNHDVIRRIFLNKRLNDLITDLCGENLGLHFNLSPFVSTERGWHQDEYLNPPGTFGRYIAAWVAVDEVPASSGPFEFIAGSHKLPSVSREKVMPFLKQEFQLGFSDNYDWSVHSSMFVNPSYFFKFVNDNLPVTKFMGQKGDVLLWHSRLIHRGSPPTDRDALRPGIIGHYSPIQFSRWFGADIRRFGEAGGYYWHFEEK